MKRERLWAASDNNSDGRRGICCSSLIAIAIVGGTVTAGSIRFKATLADNAEMTCQAAYTQRDLGMILGLSDHVALLTPWDLSSERGLVVPYDYSC